MSIRSMLARAAGDGPIDAADVKEEMKRLLNGRTPDQQKVIKYFYRAGGCLSKTITDQEYEGMVMARAKSMDFKKKALDKIGIDESQVTEVAPIHFEGFLFNDEDVLALNGKDNLWRSSAYQITWLFFSSTQIYVYQYTFHLDSDEKKEKAEEYFYKDVTSFSATSDTVEKMTPGKTGCTGEVKEYVRTNVDTNRFALVVPGEKFYCAMQQNDYTEKAIQGMKAKLREKKG